jgi:uncharacterized protein (DUF1778 family)
MKADMPSIANENSERMSLRVPAAAKAKLVRAAALRNTDLTDFVTQSALREAEAVIEEAETIKVSKRDHLRILELLENPPQTKRQAARGDCRFAWQPMTLPAWHEEPIAKSHGRAAFDCGDAQMNEFLLRFARQSHEQNASKTFCAIDDAVHQTAFLGSIRSRLRQSSTQLCPMQ